MVYWWWGTDNLIHFYFIIENIYISPKLGAGLDKTLNLVWFLKMSTLFWTFPPEVCHLLRSLWLTELRLWAFRGEHVYLFWERSCTPGRASLWETISVRVGSLSHRNVPTEKCFHSTKIGIKTHPERGVKKKKIKKRGVLRTWLCFKQHRTGSRVSFPRII